MRTLLVDGEWNLRRNFNSRKNCFAYSGEHCGGVFGFLETLASTISTLLPDRVIVMWDGDMSGKFRHDIYPLYKHDNKSWDEEMYFKPEYRITEELNRKVSCSNQKRKTKNLIDGLFIRQVEIEYIEGDDLIAQYVLTKEESEEIFIFSRDKDYQQLIDDKVNVFRPDKITLTVNNFQRLMGYTHKNALLLKCIEGDESDNISGVPLVKRTTVFKYFPLFKEEEYTIGRIIDEAVEIYNKKKGKKHLALENIIGSRQLVERNQKLMDLKNPFLNEEAINEINIIRQCVLAKEDGFVDRSVSDVMKEALREGYGRFMLRNDVNLFFTPYYRIAAKEKEYTRKILNSA